MMWSILVAPVGYGGFPFVRVSSAAILPARQVEYESLDRSRLK
jgi:hypothetical protein